MARNLRCKEGRMASMDGHGMQLAAKLLAKARSTDYDAEALALVKKCEQLLADVLTAVGEPTPTHVDRCLQREPCGRHGDEVCAAWDRRADAVTTFGTPTGDQRPHGTRHIDLTG